MLSKYNVLKYLNLMYLKKREAQHSAADVESDTISGVRDMLSNTIGNNIRKMRKKRNLSQEELAKLLNIRRQTISSYERGKSIPDIYILIQMAKIFQISLDELAGNAMR